MALATQCPHCHTAFRVAHDQLKLRAGLVRCGACKQIFNGIEHLLPPDDGDAQPASSPPLSRPAMPAAGKTDEDKSDRQSAAPERQDTEQTVFISDHTTPPEQAESGADQADVDPLQRMTLMDFTYLERRSADDDGTETPAPTPTPEQNPDVPDPLEQAMDALQRKPLRKHADDLDDQGDSIDDEEPSFVKQGRRRRRVGRTLRILMGIGSIVLFIGLLAQSANVLRNQIAAWFPQARPLLAGACSLLNCQVGLPAQIEAVSIESSELQALTPDKNTFALTVLLRNHSAIPQAWPNIELTLNDMNEKALARRVFAPRDYLAPPQDINKGLGARSEQTIKIFFELSQLKASGFRVYLFYP